VKPRMTTWPAVGATLEEDRPDASSATAKARAAPRRLAGRGRPWAAVIGSAVAFRCLEPGAWNREPAVNNIAS